MAIFGKPNIQKLKSKGDIKGLIKALHYLNDESICKAAIGALTELGSDAVEPLIDVLNGEDSMASVYAAKALGKIGDTRAVEPLIAHMNMGIMPEVDDIMALGDLGDARAVDPLLEAIKYPGYWVVRAAAAEALGKIGDPRAGQGLLALMDDEESRVRGQATGALSKITPSKKDL